MQRQKGQSCETKRHHPNHPWSNRKNRPSQSIAGMLHGSFPLLFSLTSPLQGSVKEAEFICQAKGLIVLQLYASTSSISTSYERATEPPVASATCWTCRS